MKIRPLLASVFCIIVPALVAACASSEVDKYAGADPDTIVADIAVRPTEADPDLYSFKGPAIDARAGFGAFATGMFKGGSGLGSSISLHGTQKTDGSVDHQILVTFQYTNLGGAYRSYDRAGIEGVDTLSVTAVDRHKQFTANGVIMTETIAVEVSDPVLRSRQDADIVLRVGTDSGNLETLQLPKNYVIAYLRAVDQRTTSAAAR